MGVFDKFKDQFHTSSPSYDFPTSHQPIQLGQNAIFRYRQQRGVNLGSWFSLERWICQNVFRNASQPGQSDFDVASGKDAKRILEEHWDTWIRDEDWKWIKDRGFNSVRIPISYYHLCGPLPEVLKGTDFEPFHHIFEGAWGRIKRAIEMAGEYGLGVLIDLHGAAGAQNSDAHAGLSKGKVGFWDKHSNLASTSLALRFLASELCNIPHIVGLELLNEPANNSKLQGWYKSTIEEIRSIVPFDFPLYISDAWDTGHYSSFVGQHDKDFIVLDHHLYRCFTESDKKKSGYQHSKELKENFQIELKNQSEISKRSLIIGEWSASLDSNSFGNISDTEKDSQRREFVKTQLELFENDTSGYWFWTFKKGDGWDAGWSAKDANRAEILPNWVGGKNFKGHPPQGVKERELHEAHNSHTGYWSSHGGSPDPTVFAPGFSQGWDDSILFLSHPSGTSQIGFISQWMNRRKIEYENQSGKKLGKATWEWEHGFKQGVEASLKVCTS
ncbi:uncharacterized protein I206_102618 [Kwoniella pini CBS 10737]|uniref:Cytoplasmic protein n=1 Tax=Kwoniella pini CBS 10737 TaxID=1296096 RepID=A0A1B9I5V9_9TREE|nr:cytoplasmic protein [Kwoniella pini CBS 10737]OCF50910.1 cytoplasmic protein [Kwoniella pini CBS 10737]